MPGKYFSPGNRLIFGVGCLVGTTAPAACRISIDTVDAYRASRGWALGISASPVAGRHLRGAVSGAGGSTSRYNAPPPTQYEGQAEAVFWDSIIKEIEDANA